MKISSITPHHVASILFTILFCFFITAHADDIQDANTLYKQGKHGEALNKLENILSSRPQDVQARFLRGLILADLARIPAAIDIFKSLTEDHPEFPEPYNNLAVLYARTGQYDKATQTLEKSLHTNSSYGTAYDNLGELYAEMARKAYEKALQPQRSNNNKQTELAMIGEIHTSQIALASASTSPTPAISAPPKKVIAAPPVATINKPEPPTRIAKTEVSRNDNDNKLIQETIKAWAAAWSAKDVAKYLSFYAGDFKVPGNSSRSEWEALRRERIEKPKFINVEVKIISTKLADNNHAQIRFRQSYKASHLKANNTKTMLMVKNNDIWLIQEEHNN